MIRAKIRQAAELLRERDLDCWITFTRETEINGDPILPFLTNGPLTWHSAFIVTQDGKARAIVGRYDRTAIEETGAYGEVLDFVSSFREPFLEVMGRLKPRRIAINYSEGSEICDGITYGMFRTLEGLLKEAGFQGTLESAEEIVSSLRERKSSEELETMGEAVRHAQEIFALVGPRIIPGTTEADLAAFMRSEVARRGLTPAWGEATCPSVFTGPDTAQAHYGPTGRRVEPGHLVTMDFGVRVRGYCSDLQRTWYVARPDETTLPPEVEHGFKALRRAVEAAKAVLRPGALGLDVDAAARQVVKEEGYEDFPFGLGHQVGRFAHDGTALLGPAWDKYARKPFKPLEPGMVFTIEPRLTVAGHGIVSLEEMAVVTPEGSVWLSDPQRTLPILTAR
jgi:Xaa-Pro aminopeptidase